MLKDACAMQEKEITEETINKVENLFNCLSDKEERIVRLRYGLDDGKTRTLYEVSQEYDSTREEVRQIESKAIKKLRLNR